VVHGKTGFLVDPNSTEDVTRAARDILLDRELATRLGVEGRKWALEKFSEEALSRSLRGLLGLGGARAEAGPTLAHAGGRP
jgi:glycosyltransferase involved in cell wall biosynthesis